MRDSQKDNLVVILYNQDAMLTGFDCIYSASRPAMRATCRRMSSAIQHEGTEESESCLLKGIKVGLSKLLIDCSRSACPHEDRSTGRSLSWIL